MRIGFPIQLPSALVTPFAGNFAGRFHLSLAKGCCRFSLLGLLFHAESWSRSQELWRISAVADAAAATLAVLAVPKKVLWNPSKSGPQFVIQGVGSHDHSLSVGEAKGCRDQLNKSSGPPPPREPRDVNSVSRLLAAGGPAPGRAAAPRQGRFQGVPSLFGVTNKGKQHRTPHFISRVLLL